MEIISGSELTAVHGPAPPDTANSVMNYLSTSVGLQLSTVSFTTPMK